MESDARPVKLAHEVFESTKEIVDGPPIVLAHGMFGSQSTFHSVVKLLNQGRKVITVDIRNHGDSPHGSRMDYFALSEDLGQLLSDLGIKGCVVLGHSMGGKTAMVLALTQPDMVSKLIVEDVPPTAVSGGPMFRPLLATLKAIDFSNATTLSEAKAIAMETAFKLIPNKQHCEYLIPNVVSRDSKFKWRLNIDAMENHLDDLLGFPVIEGSYHGKTLFIKAVKSNLITKEDEPEMQRLFPNSQMETIDATHMVHEEKPQEFVDMVKKFLN